MYYENIVDDIINNFQEITSYSIQKVVYKSGEFIQHRIDEIAPDIIFYIKNKYNIDPLTLRHGDLLYQLDDEILYKYYKINKEGLI